MKHIITISFKTKEKDLSKQSPKSPDDTPVVINDAISQIADSAFIQLEGLSDDFGVKNFNQEVIVKNTVTPTENKHEIKLSFKTRSRSTTRKVKYFDENSSIGENPNKQETLKDVISRIAHSAFVQLEGLYDDYGVIYEDGNVKVRNLL